MDDVEISIQWNVPVIQGVKNKILQAASKACDKAASAIKDSGTVPYRLGDLQRAITVDDSDLPSGVLYITDNIAYAHRLYTHPEYNFYKGMNAGANAGWFDDYLTNNFLFDAFSQFLGELLS